MAQRKMRLGCGAIARLRFTAAFQAEETVPVPAGAGDCEGGGREARESLAAPAVALFEHHDVVQRALPFPNQYGAGFEAWAAIGGEHRFIARRDALQDANGRVVE